MQANLDLPLTVTLPEGFTVRGAALDDVDKALNLFNRWSQAVILVFPCFAAPLENSIGTANAWQVLVWMRKI
jgi:hypothetical protein